MTGYQLTGPDIFVLGVFLIGVFAVLRVWLGGDDNDE